jgi:mannose-1-phosphate guanylyltransferase
MSKPVYYAMIMAGGIGSRFWPMSRQNYPKQFIDVLGTGQTLLQMSFNRLKLVCDTNNIGVITNRSYKVITQSQLHSLNEELMLLEPTRRNTAPCIAYAVHKIAKKEPNAVLIISPADHLIIDENLFAENCKAAMDFAHKNDVIVTLGIKPTRPDTGYGYIQFDSKTQTDTGTYKVKTFTEKPNIDLARNFVQSGEFLWNSGIVISKASTMIDALAKHLPEINNLFKDGESYYYTSEEDTFLTQAYSRSTNISIDYGVLEKSNEVYVLPVEFGWSDLGTWGSLYENIEKDENQNARVGNNIFFYQTQDCIVHSGTNRLIAIQGLQGYIVVDSEDVLLICKKDDEQQIRDIVTNIKVEKGDKFV